MVAPTINRPRQDPSDFRQTTEVNKTDQALSRILTALNIASTAYGLKVQHDKSDFIQAQTEDLEKVTAARPTLEEAQKTRTEENLLLQERAKTQGFQSKRLEQAIDIDKKKFRLDRDKLAFEKTQALGEQEANLQKEFRKDTRTKKIIESYDASRSIETLLADENVSPLSVNAAMVRAIRASGEVGAITESDLERFSGDPSLAASAQRIIERYAKGEVPEFDIKAFRNLAGALKKFNAENLDTHASAIAATEGRRLGNPDYVKNQILRPMSFIGESPIGGQPGQQPGQPQFSDAEIEAVMEGAGVDRANAILRLKSAAGQGQ